jgi:3'-phosphoadenosine 5'-phosphosulfate sulfotransferase (PAPS reductase)/FAD synthetase
MPLWLTEQGIEHDRVFMDTGWECQQTYEYLRGVLTKVLGPITEIRGERTMVELVRHKGMFPGRLRRFCTQELKVFPMQRYLKSLTAEPVNAVGIRRAESAARAAMSEWEWSDGFDCEVWRPIIGWSEDDVVAIHQRHGLPPNPLYLMGFSRVGCWPCIYARKAEIRLIADIDSARIDTIRALESEVGDAMQARADARGTTLATRPAWFASRTRRVGVDQIGTVVEWSRTAHGGKQFELFAASPSDAGCMRWGLCETNSREGAYGSEHEGERP